MQTTDVLIYEVRDRKAYITMNRPPQRMNALSRDNVGTSGYGTIGPLAPATTPPNYVIYGLTATDYFMIDVDSGVTSPILYMAQ